MEPHMIENELFSLVFVILINHVGFIEKPGKLTTFRRSKLTTSKLVS
jgi:hypothetical protein